MAVITKYTTQAIYDADPTVNKDKVIVSADTYAKLEAYSEIVFTLKQLKNKM